jgi:hypothetical protein
MLARALSDGSRQRETPEYPFGLIEGISGEISFLSDLFNQEEAVKFPGLEI